MGEASYKALLIGVPSYKDDMITDLPFIVDDMAELDAALTGVGYEVQRLEADQTGGDDIESAVEIFFQEAAPGETLLLFLSGHGIHHNDTDYLVPRGALTRVHDFPGKCVPIDFGQYAERSAAGDIVVFVDACREGIDLREKGVGNVLRWSDVRVRRVGERHYCHVYACSKGEFARYTTAGQSTFSFFSRALSTLIADDAGPGTLGELQERLQTTLDQLTSEHESRRQQIRVRSESDIDAFALFPRPERGVPLAPGESPWAGLVREHPAWQQVASGAGADVLQEATARLAEHLHARTVVDSTHLKDDPWSAPGFAERVTERMGWLLSKVLNPKKLQLSPAEAALLVVVPLLYTAYWKRTAVRSLDVRPMRLDRMPDPSAARTSYEHHVDGHARLVRRAARSTATGVPGATDIAWWLFHRWLLRRPIAGNDETLSELVPVLAPLTACDTPADKRLVTEVLHPDLLLSLLRPLHSSPDLAADRPERQVAGTSGHEQRVREQLIVALLTVAHRLAVDPRLLGEVVVDHVGISYEVDLAGLHETLEKARWDPRGRTRVLHAVCGHPAVGLALQQHAAALDGVLSALDVLAGSEPQLAPLEDLPAHATADQVTAALTPEGKRAYESTDLRFRLADDRIQELLMGEELYGDPALAVRELYQNALDACRYRSARAAYLARTTGHRTDWSGTVDFVQGHENGRPYIECTDNGIGMGERELREVFSHAGKRFADLPEYGEEHARWRAAGIELHPNSRFGIGVLSYFMIADDIQVTTCRLDQEGHPGQRLRVDIAGPGALFRIRSLGRGHAAGTTVRLYLRESHGELSAKDLLRRLLWVSECTVTARDDTRGPDTAPLRWEPGRLSEVAPLGTKDAHGDPSATRSPDAEVVETESGAVWWCGTEGAVLADGLWCGAPLFGGIVNLTGEGAPALTVDRKRCIELDPRCVWDALTRQVPALLAAGGTVLSPQWLTALAMRGSPELADTVLEAMIATDHQPWGMDQFTAPVASIGCFPADEKVFEPEGTHSWPVPSESAPSDVAEWRVRAWAKGGAFPGVGISDPGTVMSAHPLDSTLLCSFASEPPLFLAHLWQPLDELSTMRSAISVALDHGMPTHRAVRRLERLGRRLSTHMSVPDEPTDEDLALVVRDIFRPSTPGAPVTAPHLAEVADNLAVSPQEVVRRFSALGFRLPDWLIVPEHLSTGDAHLLMNVNDEGVLGWGYLIDVALSRGLLPSELADRLRSLGVRFPEVTADVDRLNHDDLRLLSRDLDGLAPWLPVQDPVPRGHVLAAAERFRRRPSELVEQLSALGHPAESTRADSDLVPSVEDLVLLSHNSNGKDPWITRDQVTATQSAVTALRVNRTPAEVIRRWRELGLHVPDGLEAPPAPEPDDVLILSRDLDRQAPWLDARHPLLLSHVLAAAAITERPPAEIEGRLRIFGFHLPEGTALPAALDPGDAALVAMPGHGRTRSWLRSDKPVPLAHIVRVAARSKRLPAEVAARLAGLGYTLPPGVTFTPPPPVSR
ncbi:caspase family protein [Streptomyces sp. NPDC005805]|uniref:wHTH domain-containing protein n=1 Tax=Streptomyces sp. NPDC005805 TaxID=3157068 RepID=UPI0033E31F59